MCTESLPVALASRLTRPGDRHAPWRDAPSPLETGGLTNEAIKVGRSKTDHGAGRW